ncbi:hypothetical protein [Phosphitispora sp. TUW77]|uniref:hypothetical protein n=1 Tax=Phosphitispora sp. TUW77 TaxID=3152361 RepID=UPI003AB34D7E
MGFNKLLWLVLLICGFLINGYEVTIQEARDVRNQRDQLTRKDMASSRMKEKFIEYFMNKYPNVQGKQWVA